MRKKLTKIFAFTITALLSIPTTLAAYGLPDEYKPDNIVETTGSSNTYDADTVTKIIGELISGILGIVGVIAVYFLVSNALKYVTSFGQQDKIDQAKKGIFWAIGGLLIIILSYVIVRFAIKVVIGTDEAAIDAAAEETSRLIMSFLV